MAEPAYIVTKQTPRMKTSPSSRCVTFRDVNRARVPVVPKEQTRPCGQMLHEVLSDGAWAGRRAFIVGGGPSLHGFDFSRLAGELTIGINRAFEWFDPTIIFSMDARFLNWVERGEFGDEVAQRFREYDRGLKVFVDTSKKRIFSSDILLVDAIGGSQLSESLVDGLVCGQNSGHAALNLTYILGANPIYLLGFDMHGDGKGRQAWAHNGYPIVQRESIYHDFIEKFDNIAAPSCESAGVRVVNLNRQSALRCFEFGDIEDVIPDAMPVVVSFYTAGTGYEAEAERLKKSLRPWGLRTDIVGLPNRGSWQANTLVKPRFILDMLEKHQRPVVWIDADATVERFPDFFDGLADRCDMAVHRRVYANGRKELLSGTVFFANTEAARNILLAWESACASSPNVWDQRSLETTLQAVHSEAAPVIVDLPPEYCAIFDGMPEAGDNPVVLQWQASRRLKNTI